MSEQLNNGKGFLKEKLGDYQVNPPDKVWDSIASQLGDRSRRNMIIITLSAAASIALAVTLGINFFGPELPEEDRDCPNHENVSQEPRVENENTGISMDQIPETENGEAGSETEKLTEEIQMQISFRRPDRSVRINPEERLQMKMIH